MKQFFRYARSELNGKYISSLLNSANFINKDISDELIYQAKHQWKLYDETEKDMLAIREEDLINIAKIAGLFQFYLDTFTNNGSIVFTTSNIFNNQQRSERGLYNMYERVFNFVRLNQDNYTTDIVTEASNLLRSTLVPEGTDIVGYLPQGYELFDPETGDVLFNNLLQNPPTNGSPYDIYYGDKFLVHEYLTRGMLPISIEVFKLLLECLQRIRYNGTSIHEFMVITEILGIGAIYNIEITHQGGWFLVEYDVRTVNSPTETGCRIAAWQYICRLKFKLFIFTQREEE